jgi:hypothetical protein
MSSDRDMYAGEPYGAVQTPKTAHIDIRGQPYGKSTMGSV